jgi:3-oxoacyl-[acyl-carrier protein] reductase
MASAPAADDRAAGAEFFHLHHPASLLQPLIDPKEIAHLVALLASPLSSATNGAAMRAEGGLLGSSTEGGLRTPVVTVGRIE